MSFYGFGEAPRKKKRKGKTVMHGGRKFRVVGSKLVPVGKKKRRSNNPYSFGNNQSIAQEYYSAGKNIVSTGRNIIQSPAANFVRGKIASQIKKHQEAKREKHAKETRMFLGVREEDDAMKLKRFMGY